VYKQGLLKRRIDMKMKAVKIDKWWMGFGSQAERKQSKKECKRKFRRAWRQAKDKIEFVCVPVTTGYRN
jgi:hypothetical protein